VRQAILAQTGLIEDRTRLHSNTQKIITVCNY